MRPLWVALALVVPATSGAQPAPAVPSLADYMRVLGEHRLIASETGSIETLRATLRDAEAMLNDRRPYDASVRLFEIVESPRFADFQELPEFRGAEFDLATALLAQGAALSARRYLRRILTRGPEDLYFRAAVRRMVDLALATRDLASVREELAPLVAAYPNLPEDTLNEIRYLEGKLLFERDAPGAEAALRAITRRSRFYGPALYLRAVLYTNARDWRRAEEALCQIARPPDTDRFGFFVDDRYFQVQDLARLGLGRLAGEQRRALDAFYYYFQVPEDSDRLQEALFEAAWALYEGDKADVAIDLLNEMERSFPGSPFRGEAMILRAYVALDRCDYEDAERTVDSLMTNYQFVADEIDRILASPERQRTLFDELLARAERRASPRERTSRDPYSLILSHLHVDPDFLEIHEFVRLLDQEAARAGRLAVAFAALEARVERAGRIVPAAAVADPNDEVPSLDHAIDEGREHLRRLLETADRMARDGAPAPEIDSVRAEVRRLGGRLDDIERRIEPVAPAPAPGAPASLAGAGLEALLSADTSAARPLRARVASLRRRLVGAASAVAVDALRGLREDLRSLLRRGELARIDASLGMSRRIEQRIETLASGRFPPELMQQALRGGYIGDDQEYWPYEGEYWADEYE